MAASTQSSQTHPWTDMEDDHLNLLVLHTDLALKHIAHFLNVNFERDFNEKECASRHKALELSKVRKVYRIRAYCGLKQKNGRDDWTPEMDRTLCVLFLRNASNRQGKSGYGWSDIELKINNAFMSDNAADLREAIPERVTTIRNAKARWYLLENQLVDGSTAIQEVNHMSQGEVDVFMEKLNEYPR